MLKKKLEVVELNKKEEKIVLEEKQSKLAIFWKKYRGLIFVTTLILSLTILILGIFISVSNLYTFARYFNKSLSELCGKVETNTLVSN